MQSNGKYILKYLLIFDHNLYIGPMNIFLVFIIFFQLPYSATDISDEVSRLRPPRLLPSTTGGGGSVTAYNRHEADGAKLLSDLEKGRYTATDRYRYHLEVTSKDTLLLTDKRVVYAVKNELFGGWQVSKRNIFSIISLFHYFTYWHS